MNFWQRIFRLKKKQTQVNATGRLNAIKMAKKSGTLVLVAPATGQLRPIKESHDEHYQAANGIMLIPNGGNLMLPVSGIVSESTTEKLIITDGHGQGVTMTLVGQGEAARLACYGTGQQLHAGDVVGTANQKILAQNSEAVRVYVVWAERQIPTVRFGSVYAGQNIWQSEDDFNDKQRDD